MQAEKPARMEMTVGWLKEGERSRVYGIYLDQGGDFMNVGTHNTFVARNKDGLVVGAITIEDIKPGFANLRTIAVDSEFQNMGVGRKMLEAVLDELKKMDYKTVTTEMPEFKQNSKEFLIRQGFRELNHEIMIKEL